MMNACARKFDAVLVWKLDRFGRSLRHLVNALAEFESLGVAFVSLRDNLDLSTPSGRLMFQIIGAMAEFERALIQERIRAGLRYARSKGKRLGRPTLIVDRARIASLRAQGRGWKAIAREMGLGVGTVRKAAQKPSNLPDRCQGGYVGSENPCGNWPTYLTESQGSGCTTAWVRKSCDFGAVVDAFAPPALPASLVNYLNGDQHGLLPLANKKLRMRCLTSGLSRSF